MANRRLLKELSQLKTEPIAGLAVEPKGDNLLEWGCTIKAASDSPYKGGTFQLLVTFPDGYPFKAPDVRFTTRVYHPGIDEEGRICIPMLKDEWKPTISMTKVMTTVQEKLNNPSADDPFNADIAAQMKSDRAAFLKTAKDWTRKYA
ncbi:ubiquitin-conjugating enzyme [Dacryopinax primogenitus]|uniref:E2 ubiquitin-conjugating enzyme n=1 Tax=Dacryopinax primogenitus (strain DJM 731) TaxID=1858805 RepID=M5GAV7_DACPD|nr:ubiquitin-conjugating enzyme [Dacryopinax primogenitus]EJU05515.1 ubiquitin-conjugating enzyme [Dacryopinax primogenitus]